MAFRGQPIVGGGTITKPTVQDNVGKFYERMESTRRFNEEFVENQRQFNENAYQKAVDQNIRMKWLEAQHRSEQYKIWENEVRPNNPTSKFSKWYPDNFPEMAAGTKFSKEEVNAAYENYEKLMGHVSSNSMMTGATVINPFTGLHEDVKGGWEAGKEVANDLLGLAQRGGSHLVGGMASLFGQQDGGYYPGNRTGDKNPALLEDGEYVLNRNAVEAIGKDKLDEINYEDAPRFQQGGFTGGMNTAGQAQIAVPTAQGFQYMQPEKKAVEDENNKQDGDGVPTKTEQFMMDDILSGNNLFDVTDLVKIGSQSGFTGGGTTGGQAQITKPSSQGFQYMKSEEGGKNLLDIAKMAMGMMGMQNGGYVKKYQTGGLTEGYKKQLIESEDGSPYEYRDTQEQHAGDIREEWTGDVLENVETRDQNIRDLERMQARDRAELDSRGSWLNTILAPFMFTPIGAPLKAAAGTAAGVRAGAHGNIRNPFDIGVGSDYQGMIDTPFGEMNKARLDWFNEFNPLFPIIRSLGDAGYLDWLGVPSVHSEHEKAKRRVNQIDLPQFPSDKIHMGASDKGLIDLMRKQNEGSWTNDDLEQYMQYIYGSSNTPVAE